MQDMESGMSNEKMRVAFEAAYPGNDLEHRDGDDGYQSGRTADMWHAWKTGRAALTVEQEYASWLTPKARPQPSADDARDAALAMDLQFDIDVASALAHAENAQDAERYQWILPILTGGSDADKRTLLIAKQLFNGLDGDALVDAAMKAYNEN
jgi:hypothetical protein